jgi:hypothetical protein
MKKLLFLLAVLLLIVPAGCGPKGTGTLAGTVTIGPLVPVESSDNVTQDILKSDNMTGASLDDIRCAALKARSIVVFSESGRRYVQDASIGCDGHYAIELPAGTYTVDINHAGMDYAAGLPTKVTITDNTTTTLDIDIDTGIR